MKKWIVDFCSTFSFQLDFIPNLGEPFLDLLKLTISSTNAHVDS